MGWELFKGELAETRGEKIPLLSMREKWTPQASTLRRQGKREVGKVGP